MKCRKCGNNNMNINYVNDVEIKRRGFFKWVLWIILALFTFGLILIIPAATNSKTKSKQYKIAICQNCGWSKKV